MNILKFQIYKFAMKLNINDCISLDDVYIYRLSTKLATPLTNTNRLETATVNWALRSE